VFVHVRVPEVGGKVSILKIPGAQVPGATRGDIGKAIDASHLLAGVQRTNRTKYSDAISL